MSTFSSAKGCGRGSHSVGLQGSVYTDYFSQAGFGERGIGRDFALLVQAELNPTLEILLRGWNDSGPSTMS